MERPSLGFSIFIHAMALLLAVVILAPLVWLFVMSVSSNADLSARPLHWWPQTLEFSRYATLLDLAEGSAGGAFVASLLNSLKVACIATAAALAVGIPAAWATSRQPRLAALSVVSLLVADHHHRTVVETGHAANDGVIVRKVAITRQRREFSEERVDIIAAVRPVGVARHLAFLPARQLAIKALKHHRRLGIKRRRLVSHVHLRIRARERTQFLGLALDLGKRLFELEIVHATAPCLLAPICAHDPGFATGRPAGSQAVALCANRVRNHRA